MLDNCLLFGCALYLRVPVHQRGFEIQRAAQDAQVMLRHVLHPRAGFADSESDRVELPGCAERPRHVPRAGSRRARGRCGRHYCSRGLKCQEVAPVSITCSFPVHNVMPPACTIHKYKSSQQHVLVFASACASYKTQAGMSVDPDWESNSGLSYAHACLDALEALHACRAFHGSRHACRTHLGDDEHARRTCNELTFSAECACC